MQMLLEFFPLVAFVAAYFIAGKDFYAATSTLMVAMVISLAVLWIRSKKLPRIFAVSTLLVLALGALTLQLRNPHFIQWKPSVLMWAIALAFLISAFVGREPLAQRVMQSALGDTQLPRSDWLKLNTSWVLYCLLVGGINLVVVYTVSEAHWVMVKIIIVTGSMLLFVAGQMLWLVRTGRLKP
jgi:intracellular septation protein